LLEPVWDDYEEYWHMESMWILDRPGPRPSTRHHRRAADRQGDAGRQGHRRDIQPRRYRRGVERGPVTSTPQFR